MTETPNPPPPAKALAVARYDGPRSIDDLTRYSLLMAGGDGKPINSALPATFRNNPAAIAFAVEYAKALDVSPITALTGIHIVDGKPTASAGLISALIRRAGHELRVSIEGTYEAADLKATATIVRADDPSFTYRSVWTMQRAVRAGLLKTTPDGRIVAAKDRSAWATYPENMLKARAITEVGRDAAEDALLGVHYTAEELGADVDPHTGETVYTVTQVPGPADAPAERPATRTETAPQASNPPPPVPDDPAFADRVRDAILSAQTEAALVAVWDAPDMIDKSAAVARGLTVGDENDEATTVFDLFVKAGAAIKAGTPLVPDAELVPDPEPAPAAEPVADRSTDPRAVVAAIETAIRNLAVPQARAALDLLMQALPGDAVADVVGWAQREGHNPTGSAANCATIVARGVAYAEGLSADAVGTLYADPNHPEEKPHDRVIRVLGHLLDDPDEEPSDTGSSPRRDDAYTRSEAAREAARRAIHHNESENGQ
jgi:hypothetical protein